MVASQDTGKVYDITHGGDFTNAIPFASGLDAIAKLEQDTSGRIFVSEFNLQRVMDITPGGNFSNASPFAIGKSFMGLTIDGEGRMLSSPIGSVSQPGSVYNITAGGSFAGGAPAFASGLTSGETNMNTAPAPEPSVGLAAAVLSLAMPLLGRRTRSLRAWEDNGGR